MSMYYHNRAATGKILAKKLEVYRDQNPVVVALSPGAILVGAHVAMHLHANLMMLLTDNIYLPGEHEAIAAMSSAGTFTYNNMFSPGQVEELAAEYHQYIEGKRIETMHQMNILLGHDGEINKTYLRRRTVILISDGLSSGFSLEIAEQFLKTVVLRKLVIATPLASVAAVDKMHLIGDEIQCLNVVENYMGTDHYYDDNTIPPVKDLLKVMRNISINWEQKTLAN
jgi:putative phosphoribosyl transferase